MFTNQSSLVLVSILVTFFSIVSIEAFQVITQPNTSSRNTRLHAQSNNSSDNERRKVLSSGAGAALSILLGGTAPAEASYTAYTRREEDWQQRSEKGGKSTNYIASIHYTLMRYWIVFLCLIYICISYVHTRYTIHYSLFFSLFFSTIYRVLNSIHNYSNHSYT